MKALLTHEMGAAQCPLCGQPNHCQLCTVAAYKGPCWCMDMEIPSALLEQVSPDQRNKACICRQCVMQFHHQNKKFDEIRCLMNLSKFGCEPQRRRD